MAGALIAPGDADPRVARGFDRLAPVYDAAARLFPGDALRTAAEAAVASSPPSARVLVVGGGSGRILPALLARGPRRVVWVDASRAMTERTRGRVACDARVDLRTGGLERLRPDERFDFVLAPFFLDLYDGERLRSVVGRLQSALSPGGAIAIADFERGRATWLVSALYALFRVTCGIEARTLPDWDAVFTAAGMRETRREIRLGGLLRVSVFSDGGR